MNIKKNITQNFKKQSRIKIALYFIIFSVIVLKSINGAHQNQWHDHQRIYQLIFLVISSVFFIFLQFTYFSRKIAFSLLIFLLLGLISTLTSEHPSWAIKEWGIYTGLVFTSILISCYSQKPWLLSSIIYLLSVVAFLNAFQFGIYYLTAIFTGILVFNVDLLFNGFSNPRFLNQFQMLFMPILAALVVLHCNNHRRYQRTLSSIFFITLLLHWCIALSLGSRGLWLGLSASHLALLLFFPRFWRLLVIQAVAAILGFLLYQLLFFTIPEWLGQEALLRSSLRFGLSKREVLWGIAWRMFLDNPWLGVGPMHFAATVNPIGAHPHQVVLQWLAEWGLFATLAACLLACLGMWHGLRILRSPNAQPIDAALWLSIGGALVLAQVDGVFVMPYTETWLAVLIGLALARWSATKTQTATTQQGRSFRRLIASLSYKLLALAVILILGNVLINEVPTLSHDSEAYMKKNGTGYVPRFWLQGWIPMNDAAP